MMKSSATYVKRLTFGLFMALLISVTSACSMSTLPWPDLSISRDEADDGLSKKEQSTLEKLLTVKQKNHQKEAVKEIENR